MKMKGKTEFFAILLTTLSMTALQSMAGQNPTGQNTGNPIVPGYFADPTIKKFGDTYYIYSTTDGEKLASGQPTVWISTDFTDWYNYETDIKVPDGLTNCWAPDVHQGADGKYYYYMGNCQFGCNIYGYVSTSPMGPWSPIKNGEPVIPVGTGKEHLPALDAQFLVDDDGSVYAYFGTWCTSFGGVGWAKINPTDMATIESSGLIPIAQLPKAFEACYPIKRNGKYILMYSSGDCRLSTYAVHYAWADHPTGPFHYGKNNPILVTSDDGTVDSPGHHSVLKEDDDYYMIYHRHDNPHSSGGMFRQICADRLVFSNDTTIEKMVPSHTGTGALVKNQTPHPNLAVNCRAEATSSYHLVARANQFNPKGIDFDYKAEYATDDNNGTLWKAASAQMPQTLVLDLGQLTDIKRVATQFEHATYFYQYQLETSADSAKWTLFADKTNNRRSGSPMIDDREVKARYIRLTVTGAEKPGMFAAVWNIKVYDTLFELPPYQNPESKDVKIVKSSNSKLVSLDVSKLKPGRKADQLKNKGSLGGKFIARGNPVIEEIEGLRAIRFDGESELVLDKNAPASLAWNSPYTAAAWVFNPEVGFGECLMVWASRDNMLMNSYTALMYGKGPFGAVAHGDGYTDLPFKTLPEPGKWHHVAVTFDGMIEKVYVDGVLDTELPLNLFIENSTIRLGASGEPSENFTGYMAGIGLFDKALSSSEIIKLMNETKSKQNCDHSVSK